MTQSKYQPNDKVEYYPVKGSNASVGVIKELVDHVEVVADRTFHPGKDQARYRILNEHTGKEFVHNEDQIIRKIEGEGKSEGKNRVQGKVRGEEQESQGDYREGQKVRYHPTGASRVESTGVITGFEEHEGEPRVVIKNDHTQKETHYKLGSILGEA